MTLTSRNPSHISLRRSRVAGALLVFFVLMLDVIFMPRTFWLSDAGKWRQETRSMLLEGRLWIEPEVAARIGKMGEYFVFNPSDDHWYSKYGIANSLMAVPPMEFERLVTGRVPPAGAPDVVISNCWNIFLSVLLAGVLYVTSGRYATNLGVRAGFVLACLFSTYLWFYQRAQGAEIYQVLFFTSLYECLMRSVAASVDSRRSWMVLTWVFAGLLVFTRIFYLTLIFLLIFVFCVVLISRGTLRGALTALFVPPFVILLLLGWINNVKFGSPYLSGYHQFEPAAREPSGSWISGGYGLLFSGHWSIFLYFPLLFLAIPGWRCFWSRYRLDAVVILSAFFITLIALSKIPTWRGEWTYGPRYMAFLLPVAALPCLCFAENLAGRAPGPGRSASIFLAVFVLGFSTWMQFEVIRTDFWFWYTIEQPLDGRMGRDIAEYLYDRHESMVLYDLQSHRQNLDATELFKEIRDGNRLTPEQFSIYREIVAKALDETNLYWWPPKPSASSASGVANGS